MKKECSVAKPRYELWGESLREFGVLILVFVPLDVLVEYVGVGQRPDARHWMIITAFALAGLLCMALGVEIERR